jgi:acetyl esterase/lipase
MNEPVKTWGEDDMARRVRAVAMFALFGASTVAAPAMAASRTFATLEKASPADVYPDRVTRFPGGVTGLADVTFSVIPGYRPMVIDIYLPPKGKAGPKPLIMYIHGGGWIGGHTRQSSVIADFPKLLASLAAEGFVVASLEYRLSGEAPFPAQVQDARAAIRFLKSNATKYGIDPARVGLFGGSAGGHLTALTALSCGDNSLDVKPEAAGSECVQGAVSWYGVFDFAPLMARPGGDDAGRKLLGCVGACPSEQVRRVSPVTYIDAKDPPFLLIHGEADKVVAVDQSRLAEAAMKAAGEPVDAIYMPGIDHSFEGADAATTKAAVTKAVNATFDFFHKLFDRK